MSDRPSRDALSTRQSLTVGITLFSMFFGAGNLILPPLLALQAGTSCVPAMVGFLVAAIGLPVLGIVAVALVGTARELTARVHPMFSAVFVAAIYLSIGPCLAIPRTSSTAFEMLVPLLPQGVSVGAARLLFSVAFFAAAYALAMRPGTLTKLLGRITGPALLVLLVMVVGSSVVAPAGVAQAPVAPYDSAAPIQGFLSGYQTMDLLASLTFGIVIAENIQALGVTDSRGVMREVSRAGVVAGVLMAVVYCGLAYVGASLGTVMPDATNGAVLLTTAATLHFGLAGTVIIAAIYLLACLNVCIGLISCCGTYFAETFGAATGTGTASAAGGATGTGAAPDTAEKGPLARLTYPAWAAAFAIFSCFVSNFGLDAILTFSVPLLNALYPVSILLVVMGMAHEACDRHPLVWPWAVGVTTVVSVVTSVRDAFFAGVALPLDALPLADVGLGWVLPAACAAVVGVAMSAARPGNR